MPDHATWIRPPMTRLGEAVIDHGHLTYATSTDGVWTYELLDAAGLWRTSHVPTGLDLDFDALPAARQFTARGDYALEVLRIFAGEQLGHTPFVLEDEQHRATRALMVFAGLLLPAGTVADARCYCGGFLTEQRRRWLHVDTCIEELHDPGQPCPDMRNRHQVCANPQPVDCDHHHCRAVGDLNAVPCLTNPSRPCCGCCHQDGTL